MSDRTETETLAPPPRSTAGWVDGSIEVAGAAVPRVRTALDFSDRLGSWMARWGMGRMRYKVEPGLYAVGNPSRESPVFVTANYKMSFDRLRAALASRDGWIMVLDTNGINVWCAAGAGTFGTAEVVKRVGAVRLGEVVSHRTLILPQLGASGVAAHEVARRTGFRVTYGPVRAADLPAFLAAGMKATAGMRRVRFDLADRIVLVPMEITAAVKYAFVVAVLLVLLGGLGHGGYSLARALTAGAKSAGLFLGTCAAAAFATAALLPWLPGRAFSIKGGYVGAALDILLFVWIRALPSPFANHLEAGAWLLLIPAISSFTALTFTGATPVTSPSGVKREVRFAMPVQIAFAIAGLAIWIAARFA